jgi:DNA-binding response OmpR family regulator
MRSAPADRPAILVIDDNHAIRDVIRRALTGAGYDVLEWADPEAAMDYLARTDDTISLALVDGVMPQMLGPHVTAEIQRLRPGTPIMLMSGHEAPMFAEIFTRPNHHYIAKPFVVADLLARIAALIGRAPPAP